MTSGAQSEDQRDDHHAISRGQRTTSLILAMLAAGIMQCFRVETQAQVWLVFAELGMVILCLAVLLRQSRRFSGESTQLPAALGGLVALLVALPILAQFLSRPLIGAGDTAEIVMLLCLQNAALGSAAVAQWRRAGGIAFLLSGFLVLFVIVITDSRVAYVLAAMFALAGMWWLMNAYWDRLQGHFAAETTRQVPVRTGVVATTLLLLFAGVALASLTVRTDSIVLPGFMPSSGGNRWTDPHARGGVGDGDMLVAAKEHALSFGPVESELFLESSLPSLYDVFNDLYGLPPKTGKQQKAISLRPEDTKNFGPKPAQSKQSGREFSTVRRKVRRRRKSLDDRDATAMFYVVGKTPLHLALATYDHFDGVTWTSQHEDTTTPRLTRQEVDDQAWIVADRHCRYPIFTDTEQHAVKIINLRTPRIPSPPHLTAWQIDHVDRLDFFGWSADGTVEMPGRDFIPQLTVVKLISYRMNLKPLRDNLDSVQRLSAIEPLAPNLAVAKTVDRDQISNAVRRWTQEVPEGWQQVEAIVKRLRDEFVHDRLATAPEECKNTVSHFLEVRRGPDYLFASAAAVMIRTLGYPTRVVSGFYADPRDYDRQGRQTIVEDEDAHVWAEVCIDGHTWIPVEPTPGYQPPLTVLSWRQHWANRIGVIGDWIQANPLLFTALLCATVGTIVFRSVVFDWLCLVPLSAASLGSPRRQIVSTLGMLEWRSWMAGRSRPKSQTLRQWSESLAENATPEEAESLRSFIALADWALYRPEQGKRGVRWPCTDREIAQQCRRVTRLWTSHRLSRQTQTRWRQSLAIPGSAS